MQMNNIFIYTLNTLVLQLVILYFLYYPDRKPEQQC